MEATKQTTQTTLKEAFAVWRKSSKDGKTHYFTGKGIVGFYNSKKENPKEPDIRFYNTDQEGKAKYDSEFCSVWVNQSKNDKTYLSGKLGNDYIVGFKIISDNDNTDTKYPYLQFYFQQPLDNVGTPGKPEEVYQEQSESKPVKYAI